MSSIELNIEFQPMQFTETLVHSCALHCVTVEEDGDSSMYPGAQV